MDDYICRDEALEKITALINKSGKYTAYESGADDACFILEHEIPAADVRPVVLCRDCRHKETCESLCSHSEDWFCGDGERVE